MVLLRVGVSFGAIAAVLGTWSLLPPGLESADFGATGRALFALWRTLVLGASWGVAPLLVALGVQEERDGGTLEILALSRVPPSSLFLGVAVARVALLGLAILGSLPALGCAIGLGGFGVDEVLTTLMDAGLGLLLMSTVSALFALVARHPLLPAVASWVWALGVFGFVPGVSIVALGLSEEQAASYSPILAAAVERHGLLGPLLGVAIAAGLAAYGGPVLEIALSASDDMGFGELSPARWRLERGRRYAGAGLLISGLLTAVGVLLFLELWLSEALFALYVAVVLGLGIASGAVFGMLVGLDLLHRVGRRSEVRAAEALKRSFAETHIPGDPVVWRDRQFAGPTTRLATGLWGFGVGAWFVLALWVGWSTAYETVPPLALGSAGAIGLLVGVGSAVEEARSRTWRVLATTPITPRGFVWRKTVALLRGFGPLVLGGCVVWAGLRLGHSPRSVGVCVASQVVDPGNGLRIGLTGVWVALQPVWMSLMALWLANRSGTRWAWPAVAAAIAVLWLVPSAIPGLERVVARTLPFESLAWTCGPRQLPVELVQSVLGYLALALGFGGLAARGLRP